MKNLALGQIGSASLGKTARSKLPSATSSNSNPPPPPGEWVGA